MNAKTCFFALLWFLLASTAASITPFADSPTLEQEAADILRTCNVQGGLVVHVGCGDGKLTAALHRSDAFLVHGLDADAANVAKARGHIHSLGIYGPVSADRLQGGRLPYIDNLVNLVVSKDLGGVPMKEVMRVLCPEGVAYVKRGGEWTRTVKPRPEEIDEWTHYLHDATGNAVAHDTVVGPPRRMQWVGSPRYTRHHDRMSSISAVVTASGRVFYITDEGSRLSILMPPRWTLVARDAFNGTILWKRKVENWHTHLWPLKSGPAQLPRRLVADGDRVYATLGLNAPLSAIDAALGETVRTYDGTKGAEEVVFSDGALFVLVDPRAGEPAFADMERIKGAYRSPFWDEEQRTLAAFDAESGDLMWSMERIVLPVTLAADRGRVYFHDGESVVCLDCKTGKELWQSDPVPRSEIMRSFYAPILVVYEGVVLFSGGQTAGAQSGSWYTEGEDTMTALSAETGEVLWTAYHPPSGYRSPEDLLVAGGLVWTGETTSGRVEGVFTGRDPFTGEVKAEFPPDVDIYWFHHRCYRGKATDRYLLMARAGTEFIDLEEKSWMPHHWVRGACLYGVMPANGLLYAPPHPCACYLEAKMYGFCALAPASAAADFEGTRLERGPAYGSIMEKGARLAKENEWPTFRRDPARSGSTDAAVPIELKEAWKSNIGGRLTQPVVAGGTLYVASSDSHTLYALDAETGRRLWQFTAGGRIDTPPTIHEGLALFGSADGWVYGLRASDGVLSWRFCAAPSDRRLAAFEQLESPWPVHGSVLVMDEASTLSGQAELWCVAGRSMFLDGGLHLWRLDPVTGRPLSHTVLDDQERETGKDLQEFVSWLNMPTALPDILSSDGRLVYMRSQPFHPDGTRLKLETMPRGKDADQGAPAPDQNPEHAHLFCPTGFLDDSGWHRTYWLYGSSFVSGWCGYYLAGTVVPAGRLLAFDDSKVYGFGRKPQYYRWTVPIEHHLFAVDRKSPKLNTEKSLIRVKKSDSLNPAGKPLTVEAQVRAAGRDGVVLANGGNAHGYALYLKDGRPRFAVRVGGERISADGEQEIGEGWVHLAGVLTPGKEVRLYVDGELAASAEAPGFIESEPSEASAVGADENSSVGDYTGPFPFKGFIDELRVYSRALGEGEIRKHAATERREDVERDGLALWYSFEKGIALDVSGNDNNGEVEGLGQVKGFVGEAMRFTGTPWSEDRFQIQHDWTSDLPLMARAMVHAKGTLFVAGPPDVLDEEQAYGNIDDLEVQKSLAEQAASLRGEQGAVLLAVSADDGKETARYDLSVPPIFDGMIAAKGRLYLALTDGSVVSYRGR